jgi:hypothetical protein
MQQEEKQRRKWQHAVNTKLEQDRPSTYNVILRRVSATIFVVEKQKVLHILSVCL